MIPRRVVTGHDGDGRSVIASDALAPRGKIFVHTPGFATALLWATDAAPQVPHGEGDPSLAAVSYSPGQGGTRFLMITFAPDAVMRDPAFDIASAMAEHLAESPGIADKFEPDAPGMHTTDTVDYGIVLQGEIWLELDGESVTRLGQHDVFVQTGTRHAWRNKGSAPATIAVVLVGAARSAFGRAS